GSVPVTEHPWGASVTPDGKTLFVTHLLLQPGVSIIDTAALTLRGKTKIADQPQGSDKRIPNGLPRGLYGVVPRPGSLELWGAYMLLAVKTAQPALDFESTVFPTISTLTADGSKEARRL